MLTLTFHLTQAAGRLNLAQGKGVMVNVHDLHGYRATQGMAAPCVTHAGLLMLTQVLGIEWASRGVRVVGIAAGPTTSKLASSPSSCRPKTEAFTRQPPIRRPVGIDDIARAVRFLAGDMASYIVGDTLRVDGGWTSYQLL